MLQAKCGRLFLRAIVRVALVPNPYGCRRSYKENQNWRLSFLCAFSAQNNRRAIVQVVLVPNQYDCRRSYKENRTCGNLFYVLFLHGIIDASQDFYLPKRLASVNCHKRTRHRTARINAFLRFPCPFSCPHLIDSSYCLGDLAQLPLPADRNVE